MTEEELKKGNALTRLLNEVKYEKQNLKELIAHEGMLEVHIPGSLFRIGIPTELLRPILNSKLIRLKKDADKFKTDLDAV